MSHPDFTGGNNLPPVRVGLDVTVTYEVSIVEGGLGTVEWTGEAGSAEDAVRQWAVATGKGELPKGWLELSDLNGDGSHYEMWLGWGEDDPRLVVTKET